MKTLKKLLPFVLALHACARPLPGWDAQHPTPQGPPPPELRAPDDKERLTTPRPHFSWRLPPGETAGVLELCRDPECKRVLVRHEARDGWTPDVDLPSGPAFWRVFGKSGDLVGKEATPARPIAIDTTITWTGKHVEGVFPRSNSEYGKRLVPKLDAAVELYAKILKVPLPSGTTLVLFYGSDEAYLYSHGRGAPIDHEAGFASEQRRDSSGQYIVGAPPTAVHVKFGVHDGFDDDPEANGFVEEVALHELAHAVQFTGVFHYHDLPAWWVEGLSDLLASRALRDIFGVPYARQFSLASRSRNVMYLHEKHKLVPLDELFTFESTRPHSADPVTVAALYAESYCLLHFLDVEQPEAFGRLMQSVANMQSLHGSTTQLRQLTGDLGAFEQRWLAALAQEPLLPWAATSERVELRVAGNELVVTASPQQFNTVRYVGPTVAPPVPPAVGDQLEATLDVHAGDEPGSCLFVHGVNGSYVACVGNSGNARLFRLMRHSEVVAQAKMQKGLIVPGTAHRLSLALGADHWILRLDDSDVLDARPPTGGVDAWGVSAFDGRSHYRDVQLKSP